MITVDNIEKEFRTSKNEINNVLKGLNFKVNKGEVYGLLGANGAGKSTLLRILSTMMRPTRGTFSINNYDGLNEPMKIKQSIGFLSTETGIYDKLTPRELLTFFGKVSGIEKDTLENKIIYLLESLNISDKADEQMGMFSTGMKQKVSIARSLIHDPEVIIYDEPTNGLDVVNRYVVKDIILKMKKQGKTIILCTHLMNDVDELCDSIGFINDGVIIEQGDKEHLKKKYQVNDIEELFIRLVGETNEAIKHH